jgi:hypothetical protein
MRDQNKKTKQIRKDQINSLRKQKRSENQNNNKRGKEKERIDVFYIIHFQLLI